MRKFISVLLLAFFIMLNLNSCKLEKRGTGDSPGEVKGGEILTDVQKGESAADVQNVQNEQNEEISPSDISSILILCL